MATIQAEIKRGVLRSLYRASTGSSLQAVLNAFQDNGFAAIKSGKLLISSSGVGHSAAFQMPPVGSQWTQDQVFALSEELLAGYDAAVTAFGGQPTDAVIFEYMRSELPTIRAVGVDQTTLRSTVSTVA